MGVPRRPPIALHARRIASGRALEGQTAPAGVGAQVWMRRGYRAASGLPAPACAGARGVGGRRCRRVSVPCARDCRRAPARRRERTQIGIRLTKLAQGQMAFGRYIQCLAAEGRTGEHVDLSGGLGAFRHVRRGGRAGHAGDAAAAKIGCRAGKLGSRQEPWGRGSGGVGLGTPHRV